MRVCRVFLYLTLVLIILQPGLAKASIIDFPPATGVEVPASAGWVDAGISLVAGEYVIVLAGGLAKGDPNGPYHWPDGNGESRTNLICPTCPGGMLIGRLGGTVFPIGSKRAFTATLETGTLELCFNDSNMSDNSGSYTVQIFIFTSLPSAAAELPHGSGADLRQNYPNPFNPSTVIEYSLDRPGIVQLDIFSVDGKYIRRLVDDPRDAGSHSVRWNGHSDNGNLVASGVYLYTLRVGGHVVASRKAVILK